MNKRQFYIALTIVFFILNYINIRYIDVKEHFAAFMIVNFLDNALLIYGYAFIKKRHN